MLARIWSESDLVVAECLRSGAWVGATPADLAAVASILVFEARREGPGSARPPAGTAARMLTATVRLWAEIAAEEDATGLPRTREPDLGFASAVAVWARGGTLGEALVAAAEGGQDLSAGDFVRWCRQVIDLLDQVRVVADDELSTVARDAVTALRRGVVALGSF